MQDADQGRPQDSRKMPAGCERYFSRRSRSSSARMMKIWSTRETDSADADRPKVAPSLSDTIFQLSEGRAAYMKPIGGRARARDRPASRIVARTTYGDATEILCRDRFAIVRDLRNGDQNAAYVRRICPSRQGHHARRPGDAAPHQGWSWFLKKTIRRWYR